MMVTWKATPTDLWEAEGFDPSCRRAAGAGPAEVRSDFPVGTAEGGVAGEDLDRIVKKRKKPERERKRERVSMKGEVLVKIDI